jgi:hypothetical protein
MGRRAGGRDVVGALSMRDDLDPNAVQDMAGRHLALKLGEE